MITLLLNSFTLFTLSPISFSSFVFLCIMRQGEMCFFHPKKSSYFYIDGEFCILFFWLLYSIPRLLWKLIFCNTIKKLCPSLGYLSCFSTNYTLYRSRRKVVPKLTLKMTPNLRIQTGCWLSEEPQRQPSLQSVWYDISSLTCQWQCKRKWRFQNMLLEE